MKRFILPVAALAALAIGWSQLNQNLTDDKPNDFTNWSEYLGGPDRNHYSALTQINPDNVKNLQVAWRYSTPDSGQIQTSPIIIDGVLYGVMPNVQAFALDAASGKEIWRYGGLKKAGANTSRGVTYWAPKSGETAKDVPRILHAIGPLLYALDAKTGQPIPSFGQDGHIDLHDGLGEQAKDKFIVSNTPGTLFEDLIIMPVRLSEEADAAPGYVRAFNVRTGKLVWTFHTIPHPGEYGYETWPKEAYRNFDVGGANNWSGMAVDRIRGIIYVPTGSPSYDFYGGNRKGQNLFANCLLALDVRTGKRLWHYQAVHHDLWDRDFPAPPNLITVTQNGPDGRPRKIDAVAQVTKTGYVFVFDRVTGKPLFPIREVPIPKSDMPGESTWPTQPVPQKPAPFVRQGMTEADINPNSVDRDSLLTLFRNVGKRPYEPITDKGWALMIPGTDGGAEWGGAAADPDGILYVNANDIPWLYKLIDTPKQDELAHLSPGQRVYAQNCISCHGPERKGNPRSGYPSLVNIGQRRDRPYVMQTVSNGRGMMPGFTALSAEEKNALVAFLFDDEKQEAPGSSVASKAKRPYLPYKITGYNRFQDSQGYPAIKPPWGTLSAINLNTGEYVWKIPLGEEKAFKAKGIANTGTENYGGPVVTASGLIFIGGSRDEKFRAFDKKTGKLLWETDLPAAGFATPATYQIGSKQYVVIACGGGKIGVKKGNQYVAFALP
ncbi:outer membrane protein assembly factor BamB family protein [Spirosoma validum]|uniref:PQQ-binding-like beta-propeller repeat protein n=1 Tax=Spirosoma validum TaxID=2771355 RepID=A0A927GE04_9BACT|nr:PQQ-binding-like beta-propeller repeat protein [Spirosoma validum]MBD2754105.1 PQQ-binding-like beta-propeller repeat protein [Spirosoma validum]